MNALTAAREKITVLGGDTALAATLAASSTYSF
jgi:hypothetical protein